MSEQIIYLTQEGLTKLQEELRSLKEEKRVEIAEKLKEAISYWDLSENSEYEDARNEQSQVEQRIIELEDQLKRVEIIKEASSTKWGAKKINMWMTVTISESGTKHEETYKIVGTTEADVLADVPTISNESSVWKAILWKKKGDSFSIKNGAGEKQEYSILNVE